MWDEIRKYGWNMDSWFITMDENMTEIWMYSNFTAEISPAVGDQPARWYLDLIMHQGGQLNQAVTAGHHIVRCGKTTDVLTVLGTHCLIFFGDQTLKNVTARTQTFHLQMGDLTMV